MSSLIRIRTEPCSICEKTIALTIPANQLEPNITGLDLFLDLHGLDEEQSHARLLYIDAKGFVRTITIITKFTTVLDEKHDPE